MTTTSLWGKSEFCRWDRSVIAIAIAAWLLCGIAWLVFWPVGAGLSIGVLPWTPIWVWLARPVHSPPCPWCGWGTREGA